MKLLRFAGPPILVALLVSSLQAQPLTTSTDSIDLTVMRANQVVVGRILEIGPRRDGPGGPTQRVLLLVIEQIKGSKGETLALDLALPVSSLTEWQAKSNRLLIAESSDPIPTVIDLDASTLAVVTAGLTVLRKPEEVLDAARNAVRRNPPGVGPTRSAALSLPRELLLGTRFEAYMDTRVVLPANDQLERYAHEILRGQRQGRRTQAVEAMRYFRSDENIRLLTSLLGDSEWGWLQRAEEYRGHEVRVYLVRQTAYEILKEWRVNVTAPVLKEEAYKPEAVTLEDISNKRVSADDIRALTPFSNLNRLVLLNAQFQDGAARELRRLQSVTHLTLAGSNVTDEDLPYLAELSRLEDLDLKATRITDVGLRMIAAFSALRRVDISRTRVTDATIGILKTLRPDLAIER